MTLFLLVATVVVVLAALGALANTVGADTRDQVPDPYHDNALLGIF
jgi:hypothetical protein